MTERLWFKIGDTAARLGVSPKELRYWEKVIPEIRPRRSRGNLRYYHVDDLPRLERIRQWLAEGLTVADCRELLLRGQLTRGLALGLEEPEAETPVTPEPAPAALPPALRTSKKTKPAPSADGLADILRALKTLHARLSHPPTGRPPRKAVLDQSPEVR